MSSAKKDTATSGFYRFVIGGIACSLDHNEDEALAIAAKRLKGAGIDPAQIHFKLCKKSIDARKKNDIKLVFSVSVERNDGSAFSKRQSDALSKLGKPADVSELEFEKGNEKSEHRPLVVGMGPAGLFCALVLAEQGYKPVIIDRGDAVGERINKTKTFAEKGILDTESNVQFGAGGAGTFSDGKLVTRIGDSKIGYVLRRFCDFGAPEDILISAKPHIGTDLLVDIVDRMLCEIERLGGEVIYRCRLDSVCERSDKSVVAKTTKGDIVCSSVVLAIGHSARDTYNMLMNKGLAVEAKPFSVGVRIEHLADDIDKALYGDFAGHKSLGRGEYHLSDTSSGRGVYTFCMCPGGEVVAAASDEETVLVNGMSNRARDGKNSNSAILATVRPSDFGGEPRAAIEYQHALERRAFDMGGRDYSAPVQTVGDFFAGKATSEPDRIQATYGGGRVRVARLDEIFPQYITDELKLGLVSFDRKIKGFAASDALLTGVETRSSAPLRILRTENMCAVGRNEIYPCGEGAGYAGGITSAAVDGIRVALAIMKRFAPLA